MPPLPVSLEEVRAAAGRIAAVAPPTPLVRLPLDGAIYAKAENLQRTNSFKLRGAFNFLSSLEPATRARGVVAHSSGNHAQGVAYAARHFEVLAVIVIPRDAQPIKVERTLALGAEVVRCEDSKEERARVAAEVAAERGLTLVPPYDHPWIVAGQGTIGLEIEAALPEVANVLVCVGGGGLIAGIGSALRPLLPGVRIVGVEPALGADAGESFARGELVSWPADKVTSTIADGARTQSLGALNFAIVRETVSAFVAVEEAAILEAARWYLQHARLVVEPTGALTLAALREGLVDGLLAPGPTVLLVSGGNIAPDTLATLV